MVTSVLQKLHSIGGSFLIGKKVTDIPKSPAVEGVIHSFQDNSKICFNKDMILELFLVWTGLFSKPRASYHEDNTKTA